MNTEQILLSLTDLRHNLRQAQFPLDVPEAITQAGLARRIANQLNDYILPRLETIDAPLLAVVGGSTGAGKSTLVNSLVGRMVTQPGVIRPTTTSPVLVHHPDDAFWFDGDRVLPTLVRSRVASNDASSLQLVAESRIPRGLAILDAPDIDSVVTRNRDLAAQLLQAADLWIFVTSAARYADAVPWDFLSEAQERHASVAVVCDRVPVEAMREVPADLGRLMTERGLADSPLFAVPETKTNAEGVLPDQPSPLCGSSCRAWPRISRSDVRSSLPRCLERSVQCVRGPLMSLQAWKRRRLRHRDCTRMPSRSWLSPPGRLLPKLLTALCCVARYWHGGTNSSKLASSCALWRRRFPGSETGWCRRSEERRRRSRRSASQWNLAWRVSFLRRPRAGVSGLSPCGTPIRQVVASWRELMRICPARRKGLTRPSLGW
ncbi:ABC transporter [Cutibacterium acnes JCM 18920]|nr:ABC transporter [Cutibacterium acnes JCM 18920]